MFSRVKACPSGYASNTQVRVGWLLLTPSSVAVNQNLHTVRVTILRWTVVGTQHSMPRVRQVKTKCCRVSNAYRSSKFSGDIFVPRHRRSQHIACVVMCLRAYHTIRYPYPPVGSRICIKKTHSPTTQAIFLVIFNNRRPHVHHVVCSHVLLFLLPGRFFLF